jgi:hypothetical protein
MPIPCVPLTSDAAASEHKRRRRRPAIPAKLRKEIANYARTIGNEYREVFQNDHKLKGRVTRLIKALLPPKPKRRGRPRDPQITRAIRLHSRLRRQYSAEKPREIWARVAGKLIAGFDSYNQLEQRALIDDLKNRVKSRLRKRPARKLRQVSRL